MSEKRKKFKKFTSANARFKKFKIQRGKNMKWKFEGRLKIKEMNKHKFFFITSAEQSRVISPERDKFV